MIALALFASTTSSTGVAVSFVVIVTAVLLVAFLWPPYWGCVAGGGEGRGEGGERERRGGEGSAVLGGGGDVLI